MVGNPHLTGLWKGCSSSGSYAGTKARWWPFSSLDLILAANDWGYYFPVPHDKSVGSEFVPIVRCFCAPKNVTVISLNATQLHRKRGARLSKLRNEGLKKGLDCVWDLR